MAIRVPVASVSGGVQQQGLPGVQVRGGRSAADFTNPTEAFALQEGARAAKNIERTALDLHFKEVEDANRLRVNDALNQLTRYDQDAAFSENGWRNVTGAAVFSRENSKPLTDDVLEAREKHIESLMQGLGNDSQRALFQERANQSGVTLRGHLVGHEAEQHRLYKRGVLTSSIDTASRNMALYYNDPEQLKTAIGSIEQASKDLGHLEHGSEEIGAMHGRSAISKALNSAIDASLQQNDHASATRILQQFSPQMDSNDMLKAYKLITSEADKRTAMDAATLTISEIYPKMQTGDGDRMINITMSSESGGKRYGADGKLLQSPKGALGEMQVMPETAKNPGFGIRAAQNDSPDEIARVGRELITALAKEYNGDVAKAWAAYNAGYGATEKAIKEHGANWLSALPAETQAYVSKNLKAFAAGQGQYQRPTLQEAQRVALDKLGPNPGSDLESKTMALVEKQYEEQTKAIKQRDEEATGEAMRQLLATGGKWEDLPATVRGAVPIKDVDNVMAFADKLAKGKPVETDWSLYYRLKSDEQFLKDTNLLAFRDKLSDGEFKQLTNEQQKARNDPDNSSSLSRLRTPKQVLDQFMEEAGINPNPKFNNKKATAQVGRIWNAFETEVKDAEQAKGKKLDSEEMRTVAARLFTRFNVDGWWIFDSEKPAVLLDEKDQVSVPKADRQAIIDAWRTTRPDRQISEEDVKLIYARSKGLL